MTTNFMQSFLDDLMDRSLQRELWRIGKTDYRANPMLHKKLVTQDDAYYLVALERTRQWEPDVLITVCPTFELGYLHLPITPRLRDAATDQSFRPRTLLELEADLGRELITREELDL